MTLLQQPIVRGVLGLSATTMIVTGLGAVALAQDSVSDTPIYKNQFYIGIGAGISRLDPESTTNAIGTGDEFSEGFILAFGYDFTNWLSAEVYGADLGSASIDFLGQDVGDVDYRVFGVSALGTVFRAGSSGGRTGFSIYTRAGIGLIDTDTELDFERDHEVHVSFGAGLEYALRNGFAFRGELNSYDTDAQFLQFTVLKRFGGRPIAEPRANFIDVEPDPVTPVAPVVPVQPPEPIEPVLASIPKTYFDFDEHTLTDRALSTVGDIAALLQEVTGLVVIEGHADFMGTDAYNQALSIRRANSVRDALVAQGIDSDRMLVRGFGESRPAASNTTEEGRAQNRRVEVILRAQ